MDMIGLNSLKDKAVKVDCLEKIYKTILKYSGLGMEDIQQDLMENLGLFLVDEDVKQSFSWAVANLLAGVQSADMSRRLDSIANFISSQKEQINSGLLTWILTMAQSGVPSNVQLSASFTNRLSEVSLYDQILELDISTLEAMPDGESFPGRNGR